MGDPCSHPFSCVFSGHARPEVGVSTGCDMGPMKRTCIGGIYLGCIYEVKARKRGVCMFVGGKRAGRSKYRETFKDRHG